MNSSLAHLALTPEGRAATIDCFTEVELSRLQQLIARRADELRFQTDGPPRHDLELWLQAEDEICRDYRPQVSQRQPGADAAYRSDPLWSLSLFE